MAKASEPVKLSQSEMGAFQTVTEGTNKFAITLYRALSSKQTGNVFVCPLSAQMVLALAYTGAKGETAQQLATLLALPDKIDKTYSGYNSLIKNLQAKELKLVNRLFLEKTAGIKKDFQKNAKKFFQSPAEALDFLTNSDKSRKHINSWVEDQTNKKITNLLQPGTIKNDTKLVLVNAIHFKAFWYERFYKCDTKEEPFHVSKTKSVQVKMMHIEEDFGFVYDKELKAKILQLDYEMNESPTQDLLRSPVENLWLGLKRRCSKTKNMEGNNFYMIIILPDDIEGLAELEAKLEKVNLIEKISCMDKPTVTLAMPKFKMEETMELNETLKYLGAEAMFDRSKADFSGLSDKPLYVSKVVQKAFIEVNEEGTEASAATYFKFIQCCGTYGPPPQTFKADHPFVFAIMNKNHPLFIGRIIEPQN